ncbi:hypothetical protein GX50_01708 [[Emmonsia] crescens]|uniref:Uncharacterized protein n=1 Tax=[Emmonsia] crescens TaxID=73230 RepID=A0A2B7ZQM7_9EURO|nr:hypothetical protein GX50_01708 [Emmonsia crescens]
MAWLHRTPIYPHEECIAHVVWAAHIFSYLTNNRSHEEHNNAEPDSNTDEPSDCETDYETERTVILSGPQNSVRQKFLDCIAQLLEIMGYCKMLEEYLAGNAGVGTGANSPTEFELKVIDYIIGLKISGKP